jgi:high-affinity iron transporter
MPAALARLVLVFLLAWCAALPARADSGGQLLHLLDYVGAEYPQWVKDGKVTNEDEYAEQVEFSGTVATLVPALPEHPQRAALAKQADALAAAIKAKAPGADVSAAAARLKTGLIDAYRFEVAPRKAPDLGRAAALYATHCASCHGADGRGDGVAAASLDPAPANFHDAARNGRRSVRALYGAITQGVEGTSMAAFGQLTDDERWALAFHVSGWMFDDAQRDAGRTAAASSPIRTLSDLVLATPEQTRAAHGDNAVAALAWLRAHPEQLAATAMAPVAADGLMAIARKALDGSLAAYRTGDTKRAYDLALSAYLDGFEMTEGRLDSVDRALRPKIEDAMLAYRNHVKSGGSIDDAARLHAETVALFDVAEQRVAQAAPSSGAQFASAAVIILREGLEAILVLSGMAAFLRRTGRAEGLPWLHGGWIAALALGVATWWIATALIEISGAQREVIEGVTALIAAAMLLYVGFWLHSKSHGQRWSQFIRAQVSGALGKGTLWGLTAIAFVAVYREVFETVLFYQALIAQGAGTAVVAGGLAGVVVLLVLATLIIRFSAKVPLGLFFGVSSVVLAVMAVVFAGQGVAALQAAGRVAVSPVPFPTVPLLGIYPSWQTLGLQAVLAVAIALAFRHNQRSVPQQPARA